MSELVEGARLEIVYTATTVSGVRIPVSPPRRNGLRSIQNPQPFGWGFLIPLRHSSFPQKVTLRLRRSLAAALKAACARHDAPACYRLFAGQRLTALEIHFVSPLHVAASYILLAATFLKSPACSYRCVSFSEKGHAAPLV